MFEGDIEILLIAASLLIIVYLVTNFLILKEKQKITFHADIFTPAVAFVVSIIGSLIIWSSQDCL